MKAFNSEIIRKNLRNLRISKGLSVREVSDRLKIGRAVYTGYELNYRNFDPDLLFLLSKAVGVQVDELTAGAIEKPKRPPAFNGFRINTLEGQISMISKRLERLRRSGITPRERERLEQLLAKLTAGFSKTPAMA